MKKRIFGFIIVSILTALGLQGLAGCGAEATRAATGASGVTGLEIAEQMSFVTAAEKGSSSSALTTLIKLVPTGGDYLLDEPDIYVFDRSMEVLNIINEILCLVDQTRYDAAELLNEGPYIAMVDEEICSKDRSHEENNQSSGQETTLLPWVVDSSRTDNSSPQVVEFWIPESGDGESEDPFDTIRAKLTITSGKSDSHPFGIFSMDFAGYMTGDLSTPSMTGNLSSVKNDEGKLEFEFFIDGGGVFSEKTHALLEPDGESGKAYAFRSFNFGEMGGEMSESESTGGSIEEAIQVAFDEAHYLSDFGDGDLECLDRVNFDENVWEYNLYAADGSRLERDSGMSILYNDIYGWADYYGVWIHGPEGEVNVADGLKVTSEDGAAEYTVFKGGGRLIKRTKGSITLGDLVGDSFNMWDQNTQSNFIVTWNGTNLVKTGTETCGENGCETTDIPDQNVTLTPNSFIGLWKQGLGNIELVVPGTGKLSNSLSVPLYTETQLTPSSSELAGSGLTLKCYSECPKAPLTAATLDSGEVFYTRIEDNNTAPYVYTISGSDMTLKLNGVPITVDDSVTISPSSPNAWGVHTGAMVPTSTTLANWYDVWSQNVTYIYESGPNPWNKYVGLLDSTGAAVSFEAPLYCLYEDEDYGTFQLDYHGEGRLFGIPFEREESEDLDFEHWVAKFVIPDGSELDCDGTPYYTKAMSIEQNMIDVDLGECSGLSAGGVSAPGNLFTDPQMDEAPELTDAPKVIQGEIQ